MSVLNDLGQTVLPNVFTALVGAGLGETANIKRETSTKDSGGNTIATFANQYTDVLIPPIRSRASGFKIETGGKIQSVASYEITLPSNHASALLDVKPNDRIEVEARGTEPARTYKVQTIGNKAGVVRIAVCTLENEA